MITKYRSESCFVWVSAELFVVVRSVAFSSCLQPSIYSCSSSSSINNINSITTNTTINSSINSSINRSVDSIIINSIIIYSMYVCMYGHHI